MEYILSALFGGGTLDWEMIGQTEYDWEDIIEEYRSNFGSIENAEFNSFLEIIFEMAEREFAEMVDEFIKEYEYNEDYKGVVEKLKEVDFEDYDIWATYTNYLDNGIYLKVEKEIKDILDEYLSDKIDRINDNIGFTCIEIEED